MTHAIYNIGGISESLIFSIYQQLSESSISLEKLIDLDINEYDPPDLKRIFISYSEPGLTSQLDFR
jgi:hypothetical protein